MAESYVVDPSGDVIIIVRNPDSPFAEAGTEAEPVNEEGPVVMDSPPTDSKFSKKKQKGKGNSRQLTLFAVALALGELTDEEAPAEIQLRVSSRHLILASPYFKAALNGPWREATPVSADGSRHIVADEWDTQAFLILMHIIHGRNRQMPKLISLELLAKMAVLTDYYKCHEAVEMFAELWLRGLKDGLPTRVNRELALWLCISWIFRDAEAFTSVTWTAIQQSKRLLSTWGLPTLQRIVEAIDCRRREIVNGVVKALHKLCLSFRDGLDGCSFECSSIQLGALTKQMRTTRLEPRPDLAMPGYSVVATMDAARSIRSPNWDCEQRGSSHSCNLKSLIQSELDRLEYLMGGLRLGDCETG